MKTTALHVCSMCIILSSYICRKPFSEVWTNISHAHFKTKSASEKQPLYLPGRATWATFVPITASVRFESEFNYVIQYYDYNCARNKAEETSIFTKILFISHCSQM